MSHVVLDPTEKPDDLDAALRSPRVRLSDRLRLVLALLLSAALVAGVAAGVVLTAQDTAPSTTAQGGSPDDEAAGRRAVQLAAASFAANLNDYSVHDIAGYRKRLLPLLTAGFATSFGLAVDGIVSEVKTTRMTSKGTVVQTAVTSIDDDSATALVVADVHVESALGDRARHFRWRVSLVKQSGSWLVDGFEPVA